jgi:hypothetical protein
MSNLFGGGSSKTGYNLTGGGTDAPWNWGISPFDQTQIDQATGSNTQAIEDRYQQLGLGGSTMEGQDVAGAGLAGDAMTGQLQTQNVGNAALNPALQPQLNSLVGAAGNSNLSSELGTLAGTALKLAPAAAGA